MKLRYDDGRVRLYHGDARDLLDDSDPLGVDLLLTDPPYGVGYEGRTKRAGGTIRGDGTRQGVRLVRQVLSSLARHWTPDAHAYLFCGWDSWPDFYDAASSHLTIKNALIWDKDTVGTGDTACEYGRSFEVVLYGQRGRRALAGGRQQSILRGYRAPDYRRRIHPTEKPVELLAYLIEKSCPPDGLVVDTFAGSCATLLAAQRTGRRAIGVEVDERWIADAVRRLEDGARVSSEPAVSPRPARTAAVPYG